MLTTDLTKGLFQGSFSLDGASCYKSATRVRQECDKSATRVRQECDKSAARVRQECGKRMT